jgi:hypothetical protein
MVWGKRGDMVVHSADPLNAEPPRAALAESDLTGTDTFYVRNHGPVPDLNPERWRLRVDGLVEQPLELSLSGLRDGFACHEVVAVLQCAGNRRGGAPGVAGRHPAESASLPAEVADAVAGQEAAGRPVLLLARHQRRALRLGAPARRTPAAPVSRMVLGGYPDVQFRLLPVGLPSLPRSARRLARPVARCSFA